ncbi:flavodoxin domain-containing protein [Promethearchaeum syntrophicum]|uniref:Flavodoxin domain-containing protein n=1 Tax=Promethearchaeum syntrophicum TaxID=2594042 RepID=A0A5B9DBU7_9ARCH|nr:flavodoxin domain-containing protein [Candidatus Prometheoarchaeum syntrophicum]QEE16749.1 protoporphyrinogen oxidase [Candidatus Prometheoarchaeum syntrophicum]
MKNIAVIFGSQHETTIEIAEKISEILIQNGFDVEIYNIAINFSPEHVLMKKFDGFILGSGIQMGQWNPKVKKFIANNHVYFTKKGVKLGMFITCGAARSSDRFSKGNCDYVDFFASDLGLTPDLKANFGGVYDFSYHSNLNIAIRYILKNKEKKENPRQIEIKRENDSVNWDEIITFANNFSAIF